MKQLLVIAAALVALFSSCGPAIYKSTDLNRTIQNHRVVAILPANVSIKLRPNEMKKTSAEQLRNMEEKTGYDVQDKMYSWFLRRSDKKNYSVTIQDAAETNVLLKKAGIDYNGLTEKQAKEIAKILGVDALIQTNIRSDKPMSDGAAIVVAVLVGAYGSTNKVETSVNIKEASNGNLLWKYDYEANGGVGSSTGKLVDNLMRNLSKKFPYARR
ncbi:hypothetical protein [Niabella hirudinis]|uniref:hypothetical protein n=1 Tax=Niabella hirudinis TaxID=1285929 RepID=UPI003EB81359